MGGERVGDRIVDCRGCRQCCINGVIAILPQMGDDPQLYVQDADVQKDAAGVVRAMTLKHKPNGECIYLGVSGCTIWKDRPAVCRGYDCAAHYGSLSREVRRKGIALGKLDKLVLAEGRKRWLERSDAERERDYRPSPTTFAVVNAGARRPLGR